MSNVNVQLPSNLVEITSKRQETNGTRMWRDTKSPGVYYMSYANGYVRRGLKTRYIQIENGLQTLNITNFDRKYPLNPRQPWSRESTTYIMVPNENDRLAIIARHANRYTKNLSSYTKRNCRYVRNDGIETTMITMGA